MKKHLLWSLLLCCGFAVAAARDSGAKTSDTPQSYKFTDVKQLAVTPVKDQARSGTCWSFAGIGMVESELLRQGKGEHDLSEMWIVRNVYFDKAVKYVRMQGKANLGGGGKLDDAMYVIGRYGIVPEEVYPGLNYGSDRHVHGELDAAIKAYADAIVTNPNKKLSTAWLQGLNGILDAYLGVRPEKFTYRGKEYTPRSFAEELGMRPSDYVMVTSFTHHPFYGSFALEIPDNWDGSAFYNVPLEEMERIIDRSLEEGYTVNWASDVSEKGFAYGKGFAVVPATAVEQMSDSEKGKWTELTAEELVKMTVDLSGIVPEREITQALRQEAFDSQETTDDHGMLIMGLARNQRGDKFYKVKNSWGTDEIYKGYFYVSAPFVLYKTTGVMVHKDAVPSDIRSKLGIR